VADEYWIERDVEGSGHDLIRGIIKPFGWKYWGKPWQMPE
jgi:hypothetical protein